MLALREPAAAPSVIAKIVTIMVREVMLIEGCITR